MKPEEIKIGGVYSNGKKRESIRKVTKIVSQEVFFNVLKGQYQGWTQLHILMHSFARWAHHEVKETKP